MQETQKMWVWSLDWEDHLEKEMAAHSSILAWEIPYTEEPGRLQSMGWQSHSLLQGISQPRGQARVSHIASRFFTIWATREVPYPFICFYLHAFRECVAQPRSPAILAGTAWSLLQGLELNILRTVPTVSQLFISDRDALLLKKYFPFHIFSTITLAPREK